MPVLFEVNESFWGNVAVTKKQINLCQAQGNCRYVSDAGRTWAFKSPVPQPLWEAEPCSQVGTFTMVPDQPCLPTPLSLLEIWS